MKLSDSPQTANSTINASFLQMLNRRHQQRRTRVSQNSVGSYLMLPENILSIPCGSEGGAIASLAVDIGTYVTEQARKITDADVRDVLRHLGQLKGKALAIDSPFHPHLAAQVLFLAAVLEDVANLRYDKIPSGTAQEAAFALQYVLKTMDIIPDSIEGIGYSDDSKIVCEVLRRGEFHFTRYAHAFGIEWSAVTTDS